MAVDYEKAGVSLEAGYDVVRRIKKHVASTSRLGVMGNIGAFGGMFDLSALNIKEPILVSGTDGVGTKLKLAFAMDKHDTIGIDAVAMCVNDVLAQGAEPLFFLDYVAVGKNIPAKIEAIVSGVAEGCRQAGCALIGGETAEMPGMYSDGEYDIAGYTTGVVEKSRLIDGTKVKVGDVLVGIASSGVHSNGFSLVRKIFSDAALDLHKVYPELGDKPLGEVALTPTRIYVKQVLDVIRNCDEHGVAHIPGGGGHRLQKGDERLAGFQVVSPAGYLDAGEHQLTVALLPQLLRLGHRLRLGQRAHRPTGEGDEAEGAQEKNKLYIVRFQTRTATDSEVGKDWLGW